MEELERQPALREYLDASRLSRLNRVEEVIRFARMMGFQRLGLACCIGLHDETRVLLKIFKHEGFEVASVMCKTGGLSKTFTGVPDKFLMVSRTGYGVGHIACNPVAQALILNRENTQLNLIVGLCVGHDSVFMKHSEAPAVTLIAKDRSAGHNPASILYNFYGDTFFGRRVGPEGASRANLERASKSNLKRFARLRERRNRR